jgi:ribulose 1,5-bisphosphate synthetase/thiazole synthase
MIVGSRAGIGAGKVHMQSDVLIVGAGPAGLCPGRGGARA